MIKGRDLIFRYTMVERKFELFARDVEETREKSFVSDRCSFVSASFYFRHLRMQLASRQDCRNSRVLLVAPNSANSVILRVGRRCTHMRLCIGARAIANSERSKRTTASLTAARRISMGSETSTVANVPNSPRLSFLGKHRVDDRTTCEVFQRRGASVNKGIRKEGTFIPERTLNADFQFLQPVTCSTDIASGLFPSGRL